MTKSAMYSGLIMGVLFSVNFFFSIAGSSVLGLLSNVLFCVIIAATYRLTIRYRETECESVISFGRAYGYIVLMFFYAALISTLVKYLYFLLNPGYLDRVFQDAMKSMEILKLPITDESVDMMKNMLHPLTFSVLYIWVNLIYGGVLGLILSGFIKKKVSLFDTNKNNESDEN